MTPSSPHKSHGAAPNEFRATTPQMKRVVHKAGQQVRNPAARRATHHVTEHCTITKTDAQNDCGSQEDREPAQGEDNTLPKDNADRETWARKLYDALLKGPNLHPEAGAITWEVLRSTEKLFRDGPSATSIKDITVSAVMEQLKTVTFAQNFEDLVRFVDEEGVKSDVIDCSAEELLMKVARAKGALQRLPLLDTSDSLSLKKGKETKAGCMNLTMGSSVDQTSDQSNAGEEIGSSTEESCEAGDSMMLDEFSSRERAAAKTLSMRGVPPRAFIKDLNESSQNEGGPGMDSDSAAQGGTDMRGSAEEATYDRTSYFDPDPFWMVHLETMRNRRRFVRRGITIGTRLR